MRKIMRNKRMWRPMFSILTAFLTSQNQANKERRHYCRHIICVQLIAQTSHSWKWKHWKYLINEALISRMIQFFELSLHKSPKEARMILTVIMTILQEYNKYQATKKDVNDWNAFFSMELLRLCYKLSEFAHILPPQMKHELMHTLRVYRTAVDLILCGRPSAVEVISENDDGDQSVLQYFPSQYYPIFYYSVVTFHHPMIPLPNEHKILTIFFSDIVCAPSSHCDDSVAALLLK